MVEVTVVRLGLDSATNAFVIILQERGGTRILPIWIGRPEAEAIAAHLQGVHRDRPMTHDLMRTLLKGVGAELRRVTISRVEDRTYFAELHIGRTNDVIAVDARPSDSIAIALRCNAPIFASEELLFAPAEDDEVRPEGAPEEFARPSLEEHSPEALQRYLAQLRPEDFGKFRP